MDAIDGKWGKVMLLKVGQVEPVCSVILTGFRHVDGPRSGLQSTRKNDWVG